MLSNYEAVLAALRWSPTLIDRFRSAIEPEGGSNGCWVWTGSRRRSLPVMTVRQHTVASVRVAWFLTTGELPDGGRFKSRCGNPDCVRPNHVEWRLNWIARRNRAERLGEWSARTHIAGESSVRNAHAGPT
jgi:hypothetical protein